VPLSGVCWFLDDRRARLLGVALPGVAPLVRGSLARLAVRIDECRSVSGLLPRIGDRACFDHGATGDRYYLEVVEVVGAVRVERLGAELLQLRVEVREVMPAFRGVVFSIEDGPTSGRHLAADGGEPDGT
jgi:hypothetical protein